MSENSPSKETKNVNELQGAERPAEESKKNESSFANTQTQDNYRRTQTSEKGKRVGPNYPNQQGTESKEDEKVPDTEEVKENKLHGPSSSIFIKNQKISSKESLNQKKILFPEKSDER